MNRQVQHDGARTLEVRFAFDRDLVDRVKTLPRRRWNAADRSWQVPEDDVVPLVDLLRDHGFRFDAATCALYAERGGTAALEGPEPASRAAVLPGLFDDERPGPGATERADYTVSRLNDEVRQAIETAFPQAVWLVGEISGFNRNAHKRHVSFQLVEHDESGKNLSSINATLFDRTRAEIESVLRKAGDPFRLEDEVTVRLRARVDLYVPWGSYRVVVEEIDVRYTLGEAARRREEIIRRLTEEGLIGVNSALELPPVPLRVGLVTSIGSDACNDVLRTLQESGFAFDVVVHGARVQGRSTEPSVLNALDELLRSKPDVVLVCRGGGSRTDLAWFDTLALGRAVARYPLPVVVGIGHEQDHSVLDAVGRRMKTPTAAAAFVVERVRDSLERLEQGGRRILEQARRRLQEQARLAVERGGRLLLAARGALEREKDRLGHRRQRAGRAAAVLLSERHGKLDEVRHRLGLGARRVTVDATGRVRRATEAIEPRTARILFQERERAAARERRLALIHPRRVLERGYAIVRSEDGRVVMEAETAPAGVMVRAELARGGLRLRSEGPLPDEGGE